MSDVGRLDHRLAEVRRRQEDRQHPQVGGQAHQRGAHREDRPAGHGQADPVAPVRQAGDGDRQGEAAAKASTNGMVTPASPPKWSAIVGATTENELRASSSTALRPVRISSAGRPVPVRSRTHCAGG